MGIDVHCVDDRLFNLRADISFRFHGELFGIKIPYEALAFCQVNVKYLLTFFLSRQIEKEYFVEAAFT